MVGEVLGVLRDLVRTTDITFLCITHEMRFARQVSDRVLMCDAGQIVTDAAPDTLFSGPDHPRTRDFLRAVLGE